jgi:hypothetical protein
MARKSKNGKESVPQSWKNLHHRIYFSPKDEAALVEWATANNGKLSDLLNRVQEAEWSIKVAPMDSGSTCYITVQPRDDSNEFADHSFAATWSNNISAYYVACFMVLEMAERGDLYRDIAMKQVDALSFLT